MSLVPFTEDDCPRCGVSLAGNCNPNLRLDVQSESEATLTFVSGECEECGWSIEVPL